MNLRASGSLNWGICYTQNGVEDRGEEMDFGGWRGAGDRRIKIKSKSKIKKKSKRKSKRKITTGNRGKAAETWPAEYVWPWHPRTETSNRGNKKESLRLGRLSCSL